MAQPEHFDRQIRREFEHAVLRRLASEWSSTNGYSFRGQLRPVVIELFDSERLLGRWDPGGRVIGIARIAVWSRPWGVVRETLRHEMAHQYVDEVLGGDRTPHGETFREVCRARGIDPRATAVDDQPSEDDATARLVGKVQKLLALAQSSNQHEAELAAATARRLMLRFNIDATSVDSRDMSAFSSAWVGQAKARLQAHEKALALLLSDHFFVRTLFVDTYDPRTLRQGYVLEIMGRPSNLVIAEYVHGFVLAAAERLWDAHKRAEGIRSDRDRRAFLLGVVRGFDEKLASEARIDRNEGLVWVGDASLDAHFRARYPRTVSTGGSSGVDEGTYEQGRSAGLSMVLQKPVEAAATASSPRALGRGRSAR